MEKSVSRLWFSKASLIVSVGADILGDWQGGGYDSGYTQEEF
jgi:molybdopterin-containing oxidoreductase family iron-sulfur binding subunit